MQAAFFEGNRTNSGGRQRARAAGRGPGADCVSPTAASAAPTCTSSTAPWLTALNLPHVMGHEMSGAIEAWAPA